MLQSPAMSSYKMVENKRKSRDNVVKELKDLFGNVFKIEIIRSVASQCNFDVHRSSNILLEMTNTNAQSSPMKTLQKKNNKKSPVKLQPSTSSNAINNKSKKMMEIERVISNIKKGFKVLVILRGLPGSGKSHLAVAMTDVTLGPGNNQDHILSTDDYFKQRNGVYVFDSLKLSEAHAWNHTRAFKAMSRGLSPIIIDNTNTQMWEMKPYAMMATDYGYIIEIIEPDTWWAFNDNELAKRNKHNVPKSKIREMLERYDKNVTATKLLSAYNLEYKFQKPPQFRLIPPINNQRTVVKSKSVPSLSSQQRPMETVNLMDFNEVTNGVSESVSNHQSNPIDEILMCTVDDTVVLQPTSQLSPKRVGLNDLLDNVENAWGIDEKALNSWKIVTPLLPSNSSNDIVTSSSVNGETSSSKPKYVDCATEIEQQPDNVKILTARARDITEGIPMKSAAVVHKPMMDKSCWTEEDEVDVDLQIRNLKDLFPEHPEDLLRGIFQCGNGDFTWTVDYLLDGRAELPMEDSINGNEEVVVESSSSDNEEEVVTKKKATPEELDELKKCLESKIDINQECYSPHVFKVKQWKFGAYPTNPQSASEDEEEEEEVSSTTSEDSVNNFVELNLGDGLVEQLENQFGSFDMGFPKGFQPIVQIPKVLAQQIYSSYLESICQQMEAQNLILNRLVDEDEEFARKLQAQEDARCVVEPVKEVNLAEIMEEQVALNLHRRRVDEWKNLTADNLAAKLTRQKLFDSFPGVNRDALLEVYHAYGNDYQKTVDDLIASVGGIYSEVVKVPPVSPDTLEDMKMAEDGFEELDVEEAHPAVYYREEARKHLQKREALFEKAKVYYQKGMTEVAMFYSELARKETKAYDRANHLAASVFAEEHSQRLQKFDTLDLHFLFVKEAIATLDIFIDRNINLLKGGKKRTVDLFVITGRGNNSEGGRSKIKPAVIARLKKRKIGFFQMNPGLLKIRVTCDCLVTSNVL